MRLVDADILKETIEEKVTYIDGDSVYKIINIIDNAPIVKPKQGEWTYHDVDTNYKVTGRCSVCKKRRMIDNFCGNCGAKMKGGTKND